MAGIPAVKTRKVLVAWVLLIVAGLMAAEGLTLLLSKHAQNLRENDYRTYLGLAAEFVSQNDFSRALSEVEEAKRKARQAPAPYVVAGDIYYQLKQWEQALDEYDHAFERKTTETGPRLNKVWALIELGRYDDAASFGQYSESKGYHSPAMSRFIAEAFFRANKHAEAIPHFEQALHGYPNDLYLLEHLRQCFTVTNQPERVKEMASRIADAEASLKRVTASGS